MLMKERAGANTYRFRVVSLGDCFYTAPMKFTTMLLRGTIVLTTAAVCGLGQVASAAERTGLSLIKDANEYVGKDVRDKVVQIRSEKSIAGLTPNIWFVVFYD